MDYAWGFEWENNAIMLLCSIVVSCTLRISTMFWTNPPYFVGLDFGNSIFTRCPGRWSSEVNLYVLMKVKGNRGLKLKHSLVFVKLKSLLPAMVEVVNCHSKILMSRNTEAVDL